MTAVPPPGAHGGDGARVAAALGIDPADVLDLSASLNPAAPPVGPVLARHLERAVSVYPDPTAATRAMAERLGVAPERVLLTNGGAEAIALAAAELGGHVEGPEFSLYARHLPEHGQGIGRWRSNPNNPSGALAAPDDTAAVWDEAFYPLATGTWTRGDRRSWVLGSLTKVLACPGLRIGYVLAPDGEADRLDAMRLAQPRWSVNGLVCAALPELLDRIDIAASAREIARLRAELTKLLDGFDPQPACANYVVCAHAPGLRERLAPLGVVVRDLASFGLPGQARVAVPDDAGRARLQAALEASAP